MVFDCIKYNKIEIIVNIVNFEVTYICDFFLCIRIR